MEILTDKLNEDLAPFHEEILLVRLNGLLEQTFRGVQLYKYIIGSIRSDMQEILRLILAHHESSSYSLTQFILAIDGSPRVATDLVKVGKISEEVNSGCVSDTLLPTLIEQEKCLLNEFKGALEDPLIPPTITGEIANFFVPRQNQHLHLLKRYF